MGHACEVVAYTTDTKNYRLIENENIRILIRGPNASVYRCSNEHLPQKEINRVVAERDSGLRYFKARIYHDYRTIK
jgi:hypothetical protein